MRGDLPKRSAVLAACALARPIEGGCAWCGGTPLPPRRRIWCSDRCGDAFWTNHWWTLARRAAKRRDRYRCKRCGAAAPKRPNPRTVSSPHEYRSAMRSWRAAKKRNRMEVNHREPCRGAHRTLSCAHHLGNLETLCLACHREETAQFAGRRRASALVDPTALNPRVCGFAASRPPYVRHGRASPVGQSPTDS